MMIWHEKFHMCKLRHLCLFSDAKKALDKDKSGNVSVAERVVKESWYGFETRRPSDQSKKSRGWKTHLDKSKRNEGKQTKPKVKGALSNKFQGQALGLGRILCLTCFFLERMIVQKRAWWILLTGLVPHFSFSMFQFLFVAERMWDPASALFLMDSSPWLGFPVDTSAATHFCVLFSILCQNLPPS